MKRKVVLFFVGFFFLMGGVALVFSFFLQKWREKRAPLHPTPIQKIVQKAEGELFLPTPFLEQILELSCDHPPDFYVWDERQATENLLSFPLVATAKVKKVWPKTVSVLYSLKKPIAWLYDYEGVAIDEKGNLLPIPPFVPIGKLPQLYFHLPPFGQKDPITHQKGGKWNEPLQGKQITLALHLLSLLCEEAIKGAFEVERLDLSKIFAESYGKREIVILTKTQIKIERSGAPFLAIFPQILRLSPTNYAQQLGNYLSLHQKMMKDYQEQMKNYPGTTKELHFRPRIIDLRLDKLAFVKEH